MVIIEQQQETARWKSNPLVRDVAVQPLEVAEAGPLQKHSLGGCTKILTDKPLRARFLCSSRASCLHVAGSFANFNLLTCI